MNEIIEIMHTIRLSLCELHPNYAFYFHSLTVIKKKQPKSSKSFHTLPTIKFTFILFLL